MRDGFQSEAGLLSEIDSLRRRVLELERSEKKQALALEALKANETLYRALYNSTHDAVIVLDLDFRVLLINDIGARRFGRRPEEMLGLDLLSITEPEAVALRRVKYLESAWTKKAVRFTDQRAGLHFDNIVYPLLNDAGETASIAIFARDITERVKAEKLRDDVERIMRHDLKAPLVSIVNVSRLLAMEEQLSPSGRKILAAMDDACQTMRGVIDNSLDLHKMETGKYVARPSRVDALALIRGVGGALFRGEDDDDPELQIYVRGARAGARDVFYVSVEERLCRTMLFNLLANALEASPANGQVKVNLDDDERGRVLSIHNQGAVPEEIREVFFEKYATAGKPFGTGLGTYSSRLIAKTMGGEISFVTSEKHGTTVCVRLPC